MFGEGLVGPAGLVDDQDVGCDPLVIDQPFQHLGQATGGVGRKAIGVEIMLILNPPGHIVVIRDALTLVTNARSPAFSCRTKLLCVRYAQAPDSHGPVMRLRGPPAS